MSGGGICSEVVRLVSRAVERQRLWRRASRQDVLLVLAASERVELEYRRAKVRALLAGGQEVVIDEALARSLKDLFAATGSLFGLIGGGGR